MTNPTTADQALSILIPELSASGQEPILDTDGTTKLSLRQAVNRAFTKITTILPLSHRPLAPTPRVMTSTATFCLCGQNNSSPRPLWPISLPL